VGKIHGNGGSDLEDLAFLNPPSRRNSGDVPCGDTLSVQVSF